MNNKDVAAALLELWLANHKGWSGDIIVNDPNDETEAVFGLEDGETGLEYFITVDPA